MGKTIVILVDNKRRDLRGAALIAHHLQRMGANVFLEPLEAYRAVLPAYRPDLIVFNHLLASHLANYSGRLREIGVKVAVLPNESLLYNPDVMRFNSRRYNDNVHLDVYCCWNEIQRQCVLQNGYDPKTTRVEVVGNPKFDFYFPPWNRPYKEPAGNHARPRILLCTNFCLANYKETPREVADKLFDIWRKHIPAYRDYWGAIEANHRSRARLLEFLMAILKANRYEVILRPHPGEHFPFYENWIRQLEPELKTHLHFVPDGPIYPLILNCDLEISCETCTTALESWLCGKPTMELVFERHPMFYHKEVVGLNVECETPESLVSDIERQLANPSQPEFRAAREQHIKKWCASPRGDSSERIARLFLEIAQQANPQFDGKLDWSDRRRGLKLRVLKKFGLPCFWDPILPLKAAFLPRKYQEKKRVQNKNIRPADVRMAMAEIAACAESQKEK